MPCYVCTVPVMSAVCPAMPLPSEAKPHCVLGQLVTRHTAACSHSTGPCDVDPDTQVPQLLSASSMCQDWLGSRACHTQDRGSCSNAELDPTGYDAIRVPTRLMGGGVGAELLVPEARVSTHQLKGRSFLVCLQTHRMAGLWERLLRPP